MQMAQDDSSNGSGKVAAKPVGSPQISKTALPVPTLRPLPRPRPPSTPPSPAAAAAAAVPSRPAAAAAAAAVAARWPNTTDATAVTSSQLPSIEATSSSASSTPTLVSTGEVGTGPVVSTPGASTSATPTTATTTTTSSTATSATTTTLGAAATTTATTAATVAPSPSAGLGLVTTTTTTTTASTAAAATAVGPFPHRQQNGHRASPSLPSLSPSMSHQQQPPGPPRQPNAYPGQTPYPQAMAAGPYSYTTSSQPSDAYRTTTGPDPGHHLPSMRTLDAMPSQHGMAPQGPPTMGMGMGMPGHPHGMGPYYNPSMAMGGQYLQTDMMRYPLPPHDPRFQMGRGPKKEIKRRTKTGCMTCRKRRIKCDETHPTCNNCRKSKRECLGYDPIFKQQQGQQQQSQSNSASSTPTTASAPSGPSTTVSSSTFQSSTLPATTLPSSTTISSSAVVKSEPQPLANNPHTTAGYANPTPPTLPSSYTQSPTTSSVNFDHIPASHHPPLKHEPGDYNTTIDPALHLTAGAATAVIESHSSSTPRPDQNHASSRSPHRDLPPLH